MSNNSTTVINSLVTKTVKATSNVAVKKWEKLSRSDLGDKIPRRGGNIIPPLASAFLKLVGWEIVGSIPNVPKAVYLALPHTSNIDAVYTIPTLLALDLDINIMGKQSLFKNPVMASFLTWAGIIPIDRRKKGSVLQATIDKFKSRKMLHLGLSPEGTRNYTSTWKTGFYYIAHGANVPIIPVAMDYKTKQVRFMMPVHPSGDIDADLQKILQQYKGVVPKCPKNLSQPLRDIMTQN